MKDHIAQDAEKMFYLFLALLGIMIIFLWQYDYTFAHFCEALEIGLGIK